KAVKKAKKEDLEDSGNENTKNYPKLLYWLKDNKITQKQLAEDAEVSTNTIYRLTHLGKATKVIIKVVAVTLGITTDKLKKLLEK
ncbi:MAG TPA: helix-turn-helix domain-containing protein, partial [Bacteroidia bacterium]|nr:helix-turn-helix domain-containing protein [Bacteroidia bacterium]